jgi:hypothetical protein
MKYVLSATQLYGKFAHKGLEEKYNKEVEKIKSFWDTQK